MPEEFREILLREIDGHLDGMREVYKKPKDWDSENEISGPSPAAPADLNAAEIEAIFSDVAA